MASREETYRSTGRRDVLIIPPEELTLITDPEHSLYDHQGLYDPLSEEFIESIKWSGIKEPITIRIEGKDPKSNKNILAVVNGRHRLRGVIEANKRLKKEGEKKDRLLQVPCIVEKGGEVEAIETMVITNRFRHEKSLLTDAKNAKRLLDRGIDPKEVARDFGVHVTTINNWQRLLRCCKEVQDAVNEKKVPANAVKHLSELDTAAQKKALHEMLSTGAVKGEAATEAAKNAANGKPAKAERAKPEHRVCSRKMLEKVREAFSPADHDEESDVFEIASAAIRFALGDAKAFDDFPELKNAVQSLQKTKAHKQPKEGRGDRSESIDMR